MIELSPNTRMNNHYTISLLMFVSHLALGLDIGNLCWIRYVPSTIHWYIQEPLGSSLSQIQLLNACSIQESNVRCICFSLGLSTSHYTQSMTKTNIGSFGYCIGQQLVPCCSGKQLIYPYFHTAALCEIFNMYSTMSSIFCLQTCYAYCTYFS